MMLLNHELRDKKLLPNGVVKGYTTGKEGWSEYLKSGALSLDIPSVYAALEASELFQPAKNKTSIGYLDDFHRFKSWESMMNAFNKGLPIPESWQKERLKVYESSGNYVDFAETGEYVDIGRYLSCEPEHFGNFHMGRPINVFVTVFLNLSTVYSINDEIMEERGKAVIQLVDWLESNGVRCKIMAFTTNECGHYEINVKDYQELLDLEALTIVMNPDFFRRVTFRYKENSPTFVPGYGTSNFGDSGIYKNAFSKQCTDSFIVSEQRYKDVLGDAEGRIESIEQPLREALQEPNPFFQYWV